MLSDSSIADSVGKLSELDILVNNAGGGYNMPMSDIYIPETKKFFDLNVWSYIAVTQAFLPLLLKSKGMIVNQTSVASANALPFQSTYSASKAAIAMYFDVLRLELSPFDITVVDLKTGSVKSNFFANMDATQLSLPKDSVYEPARVMQDLLKKTPPPNIWRGAQAWLVRLSTILPAGMLTGTAKKITGFDVVEKILCK